MLVKNAERFIGRDEILKEVWEGKFIEDSGIDVRLNKIRRVLGQNKNHVSILAKNKKLKFVVPVKPVIKARQTLGGDVAEDEQKDSDNQSGSKETLEISEVAADGVGFGSRNWLILILVTLVALYFYYLGVTFSLNLTMGKYQLAFIYLNSFFYGALAAITLVLETAYEFQKHRRNVARRGTADIRVKYTTSVKPV